MRHTCVEPDAAAEAAEILKAIAHPLRLRIVALLCDREEHVSAMVELLGASQSAISQQLRILRMRKLVDVERRGGRAVYRLMQAHLRQMIRCMDTCLLDGHPAAESKGPGG